MVKVGGKRKKVKYAKTHKFYEIRGKLQKVEGGNNKFPKIGGEMYCWRKQGGIRNSQ